MNWKDIALRIRALLFRRQVDNELEEELQFHLEMQSRKNSSREPDKSEAKRLARLQFGNLTQVKERCRERRGISSIEILAKDLRYAFRTLRKSPGFSSVVILTMALGIGANTAIYSIVNSVLLRPLSFPEPDRLVAIYTSAASGQNDNISYANFLEWPRDSQSFAYLAAYQRIGVVRADSGRTEHLECELITAEFFDVLGVKPRLGRTFRANEDHHGAAPVVLLSEGLWRRDYGAQSTIVGQSINLDGLAYSVVGVMPEIYSFGDKEFVSGGVYLLMGQSTDWSLRVREFAYQHGIGRLKQGVTIERARNEMDSVARRLADQYPNANKDNGIALIPLKQDITGENAKPLYILLGAVGFVLLIACANNANLLLAHSTARLPEFAVRSALGASKRRCIWQLLCESVMLSVAGGFIGLLIAMSGITAAQRLLIQKIPRSNEIAVDDHALLFTLGLSLLCGILFGLVPALKISSGNLRAVFKEAGRGTMGGRNSWQRAFATAEIALALVLLAGAGLMLRTLSRLSSVDPGFNPENVLTFRTAFAASPGPPSASALRRRFRETTKKLESIHGIVAASLVDAPLPTEGSDTIGFWSQSEPKPSSESVLPWAIDLGVESGYAKAMQIAVLRGRFISEQDTASSPAVVVIDEVLARKYFPNVDPIGKKLNISPVSFGVREIIGVVRHTKQFGLAETSGDARPQIYYAIQQVPDEFSILGPADNTYVVRTRGEPLQMMNAIRAGLKEIDRQQTVFRVLTLDSIVADSVAAQRFTMYLLAVFAALAVMLASIGVYGVISYVVRQRNREIGLRIAFGASRTNVLGLFLREGILIGGLGVPIGIIASMGMTRLLAKMLYGISTHDPITFAAVTILLILVALCASCAPAMRAMHLDPVTVLRHE